MIVVGLTGSIGMGKSMVASLCRSLRIPVQNADDVVHDLLRPGGAAFAGVARQFPEAVSAGRIDRLALGRIVFAHPVQLDELERILHPLVGDARDRFLAHCAQRRAKLVLLDIPLLFEKHLEGLVDLVVTVSAPSYVQRARVMARPGMTAEKFAGILARQMPDHEKRRRSDYVINTGGSIAATRRQLLHIVNSLDSYPYARNRPRYRNHRA